MPTTYPYLTLSLQMSSFYTSTSPLCLLPAYACQVATFKLLRNALCGRSDCAVASSHSSLLNTSVFFKWTWFVGESLWHIWWMCRITELPCKLYCCFSNNKCKSRNTFFFYSQNVCVAETHSCNWQSAAGFHQFGIVCAEFLVLYYPLSVEYWNVTKHITWFVWTFTLTFSPCILFVHWAIACVRSVQYIRVFIEVISGVRICNAIIAKSWPAWSLLKVR